MEAPEFYQTGRYSTPEKLFSDSKNCDHFIIDDLLDFPNDESMVVADGSFEEPMVVGTSILTAADTSCNSSFSTVEPHFQNGIINVDGNHSGGDCFSSELCVPYDDQAELEWLSNIVDESFSCEEIDLQKLQLIQGMKARNHAGPKNPQYPLKPEITETTTVFRPEMPVPAKARSKRSRTAPANWTLRLLSVSPPPAVNIPTTSSSSESHITTGKKTVKQPVSKKNEGPEESGRKCLHCATDKTPQWRTGPMGPKTLCNACGVRYKSGRLVPEYRPAASPTFVLTKHSNSHRKVVELRRQKEMVRVQQHQFLHHHENAMIDVSNGDDYLIHQHIGPDFRQLI